jgi:hypothetical protein
VTSSPRANAARLVRTSNRVATSVSSTSRHTPGWHCHSFTACRLTLPSAKQATAEVGVLAMEFDPRLESANGIERLAAHCEVPTVEDRARGIRLFL